MTDRVEVREPYATAEQQHGADMMGIYIFLATEMMLFGGLFAVAYVIRVQHPEAYVEASRRLHVWIGAINTVVLLTSSLAVACAVHAARADMPRRSIGALLAACVLGLGFLALKGLEYAEEYREGLLPVLSDPPRFASPTEHHLMNLYLIATSLHAIHLTIGIVLLAVVAARIGRGTLSIRRRAVVVEVSGVYWHFVDVVWIFLYPVLYLAR